MLDPPDNESIGDPRPRNWMVPSESRAGISKPIFAEHALRPSYAFPGLPPFIDAAAERMKFPDHALRHRVKGDWFLSQASNALGNAGYQRTAEAAQAQIDRALLMRTTMVMAIEALDAAIVETTTKLGLSVPPFAPAKTEVKHDGPRKLRRPVNPGE